MDDVEAFEAQRGRMFAIAYRLLGSAAEAEDAVQDAYLRWREATVVRDPAAWLAKIVTNLCLNRLTSARARRERYVGPWLPEPVLTDDGTLGPLETVEQRESVSIGMLRLLERLSPPERAVFVLREAFDYSHREIAELLDVSESHARQLLHRARDRMATEHRRFTADPERHRRIVHRLLDAMGDGDVDALTQLLAEDVVAWADGGGEVTAARHPVYGRQRAARYLTGLARRPEAARVTSRVAEVNGAPAMLILQDDELVAIFAVGVSDDRITEVHTMINPTKLAYARQQSM